MNSDPIRYKLLLIKPKQKYKHYAIQTEMAKLLGKKISNTSLALPLIAAMTPSNYDITIIDEEIMELPQEIEADLVGITTISPTVGRAYEIAAIFKARAIPVIFGGPYATFHSEIALEHGDCVVAGEAEGIWERCLQDFEAGKLQKIYTNNEVTAFKTSPAPRWDLIDTSALLSLNVQTTRGCPFMCEFCLTSEMFGRKIRTRNIDDIVNEIRSLPLKNIFFADDNLTINKKFAHQLCEALIPLNITWICQSSIDIAEEPELLRKMSDAGCRHILIGFETLNPESIYETRKHQNRENDYVSSIQQIHAAGIFVYGSFIVGFDNDTLGEFDKIADLIEKTNMPVAMLNILGASSGTQLYDRLVEEGRWYGSDPAFGGGMFPLMHYNNFSQTEVFHKYSETLSRIFSFESIRKRTFGLFKQGAFTRDKMNSEISFGVKLRTSILLLKLFRFSADKNKRLLFKEVFHLVRQKKLAASEAVSTLLMLEGISRNIKQYLNKKDHYSELIAKVDKGAWRDMKAGV